MEEKKRYKENELIYPALYFINKYNSEINMSELIEKLSSSLDISDEDSEILFGRNDTKFSQKVRNMISHNTLTPYIEYVDQESRHFKINNKGIDYLKDSSNRLIEFSEYEDTETELDNVDDFPSLTEFIFESNLRVNLVSQTVYELYRRSKISLSGQRGGLVLDESFQRNSVWSKRQQSQLIESILLGIPLPLFYLSEDKGSNLIVVDGRQRLTAIFNFLDGNLRLSGLQMLSELNGKRISDFVGELETLKARIEDSFLYVARIDKDTPEIIKLQLFSRVNRNGTPLNAQEVRHALHQGFVTELLARLSRTMNLKVSSSRMKDRQYFLRALSLQLYYRDELFNYETRKKVIYSDINGYLGEAMDAINTFNEKQLQQSEHIFTTSYNRAVDIFGESAFRLKPKSPINMILFEVTLLIVNVNFDCSDSTIKDIYIKYVNYNEKDVTYSNSEYSWFENNIRFHRDSKENFNERLYVIKKLKES
ncbi:DUF262 domain-containing protein [Erysipelothrix rhusiopathiae]|uniref:DUF262 domain-containing protein n=1 Tax=Erysipelothrix rhusiopathiae TaxID=1648 RepID=UPI00247FFCD9|nr:DUF262 domain-containing protein [Erysipelothrix rhusiopathiae]